MLFEPPTQVRSLGRVATILRYLKLNIIYFLNLVRGHISINYEIANQYSVT
jgi:hypothetical protein